MYTDSIINGLMFETNKGRKSALCGRAIYGLIGFDASWYKDFVLNTNPVVYNIQGQYHKCKQFPNC